MLIRFNIENFLSFRDKQTFSTLPGKGTLKSEHKTKPVKGISVLKTSVIFGANASGKSNLIKAIAFGRRLILKGTPNEELIDYPNFRLDKDFNNKNSTIEYELQHKGKNYAYGFVFNKNEIVEEWLYEVTKKKDIKIFERSKKNPQIYDLEPLLNLNPKEEDQQFLNFIAKSTPDNQLLLTEIKNRKVKNNVTDISDILNVIDWFQNCLKIIFPDEKYREGFKFIIKDNQNITEIFDQFLSYFDTGIQGVCLEQISEEKLELPSKLVKLISNDLRKELGESASEEKEAVAVFSLDSISYFVSIQNDKPIFHKFMTCHSVNGTDETELFDTKEESDGTNRIIDFIPLIIDLVGGGNVFIIDEMERSLHPNLIYELFELVLSLGEKTNSQLIVSTHESTLLNQKLLRKDEIWFTVKEKLGNTQLYSLEEYNIRFDKEIRKDYLRGRFKAIPKIGNRNNLKINIPNNL